MRFPWQRKRESDTEGVKMSWADDEDFEDVEEEVDADPEGDEEGGAGDDAADDAGALDEGIQRALDAAVQNALAAQTEAFQKAMEQQIAAFAEKVVTKPAETKTGDAEDERPDPVSDPEGFTRWMDARYEKRLAEQVAEVKERQQQTDAWRLDSARERAVARFRELVPGSRLTDLGLSQENAQQVMEKFTEILGQTDPAAWNDEFLLMLGGAAVMAAVPRQEQPKDARGRFMSPRSVNATMFNQGWQPHPDAGRPPRPNQPSREEQEAARAVGMSVDTYRALSSDVVTIADYEAAIAAEEKAKVKK